MGVLSPEYVIPKSPASGRFDAGSLTGLLTGGASSLLTGGLSGIAGLASGLLSPGGPAISGATTSTGPVNLANVLNFSGRVDSGGIRDSGSVADQTPSYSPVSGDVESGNMTPLIVVGVGLLGLLLVARGGK